MYEQFFNFFGLREDPFHVSPDPRFYYRTRAHESALAELLYGIETRQGLLVLTGEAGTGKTTLLNQLLDWLRRRGRSSGYIFHTRLEPVELLQFILRDFGVNSSAKHKGELVNEFHAWLLGRSFVRDLPVLILDEAQALPQQTLDELRMLLNLETPRGKLLQIILAGQPELGEKLRLPALRQLRQRVVFHSRIPLLTQEETAAYIAFRLAAAGRADSSLFSRESVQTVYEASNGIPRVVNLLCGHALISAYAAQQQVISAEMVQRVAVDFDLLAKPLAVNESAVRPHYGRLVAFPFSEIPAPPLMASQPVVKTDPVPAIVQSAPVEPPELVANTVNAGAVSSEIPPLMASQPAVKTDPVPAIVQSAPVESPELVANTVNAPAIFSEIPAPPPMAGRPAAETDPVPAIVQSAPVESPELVANTVNAGAVSSEIPPLMASQPAVKTDSVPAIVRSAPAESPELVANTVNAPAISGEAREVPRYWRRHRSPSVVAVLTRQSIPAIRRTWHSVFYAFVNYCRSVSRSSPSVVAVVARQSIPAIRRTWHSVLYPFVNYCRSVSRSFLGDCRRLFRALTLTSPALALNPGVTSGTGGKPADRRKSLAPVVHWLRQPITPLHISRRHPPARSVARK
jgi:general secretion pathway protein A